MASHQTIPRQLSPYVYCNFIVVIPPYSYNFLLSQVLTSITSRKYKVNPPPTRDQHFCSPIYTMNQFIARVANWLANEVIVKSLVKNKAFQNMALRTHLRVKKTQETAKQTLEEAAQSVESEVLGSGAQANVGKTGIRPPPPGGLGGFLSAFAKEVKKDFGGEGGSEERSYTPSYIPNNSSRSSLFVAIIGGR